MSKIKSVNIIAYEFYYDCPEWLTEDRRIKSVCITKQCSRAEVDALLYGIMGYNGLTLSAEPKGSLFTLAELMNKQEIVMAGGIIFREDEKVIPPSCCCGLEQWQEIVSDIENKISPWLGHDPTAECLYEGDNIIILSDSRESASYKNGKVFKIIFSAEEFKNFSIQLKKDMDEFVSSPLTERINELIPLEAEFFLDAWRNYFCAAANQP